MARVAPSERFRTQLDEALAGVDQEQDPVETIGRLGARLILQQALEEEVSEFLGRGRYERSKETVSHRNGYEPRTVKTIIWTITAAMKLAWNSGCQRSGVQRARVGPMIPAITPPEVT